MMPEQGFVSRGFCDTPPFSGGALPDGLVMGGFTCLRLESGGIGFLLTWVIQRACWKIHVRDGAVVKSRARFLE